MKRARVNIDKLRANPLQPRKFFDESELKKLAESIKTNGLLQEIIVRPKNDYFEVVLGERRWRACKLLGWLEMPVKVEKLTDQEAFELSLAENIQRQDLTLDEEARAIEKLVKEYNEKEAAKRINKSRGYVAKKILYLRDLDRLDKIVKENEYISSYVTKEELKQFKKGVRQRTISPELLRSAVKTKGNWQIEEIIKQVPTVKRARELVEKKKAKQEKEGHKQFNIEYEEYEKINKDFEFNNLYSKKKKEYLDKLPDLDRVRIEEIQEKIMYASRLSPDPKEEKSYIVKTKSEAELETITEGKKVKIGDEVKYTVSLTKPFLKKWQKQLWLNIFYKPDIFGQMGLGIITLLPFDWWLEKGKLSLEKTVEASLVRLIKLVEMDKKERTNLLNEFENEFNKIFSKDEYNGYKQELSMSISRVPTVLLEIPEQIWHKMYHQLQIAFHPDKGGNIEIAKWSSKLNIGLKKLRDWK